MLGEKRTLSTLKYNKCAFLFLRLCLFSLYFTFLPFYNPPPHPHPPSFFVMLPFSLCLQIPWHLRALCLLSGA